jgi:hypothetical protein
MTEEEIEIKIRELTTKKRITYLEAKKIVTNKQKTLQ